MQYVLKVTRLEVKLTLQRIREEIIHAGHLNAIGAASVTLASMILLHVPLAFTLVLAAYFFTHATYAVNRWYEWRDDSISRPERATYVSQRLKRLILVSIIFYVAAFVLAAVSNVMLALALSVPLLLGYLYTVGFKRIKSVIGAKRLKDKLLLKDISISSIWAAIPFLLAVNYQIQMTFLVIAVGLFIFSRNMVVAIFCDIADVESDKFAGVRTLPLVVGIKNTLRILVLLNTLPSVLLLLAVYYSALPLYASTLHITTAYGYFYILKSRSQTANQRYLCDIVADSESLTFTPLLTIGRLIL